MGHINSKILADVLIRLGAVSYGTSDSSLTRTQWIALRYFDQANEFSRNSTSLAEYQAVSTSASSQVVNSLISLDLLARKQSKTDGRRAIIDITEEGKERLKRDDPLINLSNAIDALPEGDRKVLAKSVFELNLELTNATEINPVGICPLCVFFKEKMRKESKASDLACLLYKTDLKHNELFKICVDFQPKDQDLS